MRYSRVPLTDREFERLLVLAPRSPASAKVALLVLEDLEEELELKLPVLNIALDGDEKTLGDGVGELGGHGRIHCDCLYGESGVDEV